jgi:hypothetical protein
MVLTVLEYKNAFYPDRSVRTVQRMIKEEIIPSSHKATKLRAKLYIIEVNSLPNHPI